MSSACSSTSSSISGSTTGSGMVPPSTMKAERNTTLPADFRLTLTARREADLLLGGEPFALVRLRPETAAQIDAWSEGAPVGEAGALARTLVMANFAQPVPPPRTAKVTAVIPN